jgi:hypothetical protein
MFNLQTGLIDHLRLLILELYCCIIVCSRLDFIVDLSNACSRTDAQ